MVECKRPNGNRSYETPVPIRSTKKLRKSMKCDISLTSLDLQKHPMFPRDPLCVLLFMAEPSPTFFPCRHSFVVNSTRQFLKISRCPCCWATVVGRLAASDSKEYPKSKVERESSTRQMYVWETGFSSAIIHFLLSHSRVLTSPDSMSKMTFFFYLVHFKNSINTHLLLSGNASPCFKGAHAL